MSAREAREHGHRHWVSITAVLGGLLWIPYGVFEMLQPWGEDTEYRDDLNYQVITDTYLYLLYSVPGSLALILTAVSLVGICRLLSRTSETAARISLVLGYISVVLGGLSLAGVIARFDPLFTAPRIFGTLALGAATLLAGMRARGTFSLPIRREALVGLGLLGLFLLPLWPLVYAVSVIPEWLGAMIIALFGLGWIAIGYRLWLQHSRVPSPS